MIKRLYRVSLFLLFLILFSTSCSKDKDLKDTDNTTHITLNGSGCHIDGTGASYKGTIITISKAGEYEINGELENGRILVDTPDENEVRLVLNGVTIHSSEGSPIYIKKAADPVITLLPDTANNLFDEAASAGKDASDALLRSDTDLSINGSGTLIIVSNQGNGIDCKEDLDITDSSIRISSIGDGITGKDSVTVSNASITINSGKDGLKATNSEDSLKGYVVMDGGELTINSGDYAVKAESSLSIGSGSISADSTNDSIHCKNKILIKNGNITVSSGNDGIHAGSSAEILDGNIRIDESCDGIESGKICVISGGRIRIKSNEDGINIAGGNDTAYTGKYLTTASTDGNRLSIEGGYLFIDAEGDGLDSNGSVAVSGGTILINGPVRDENGPLDYIRTFNIDGGTLLAAGSTGPGQAPSPQSLQNSICFTFSQQQRAGTLIHLEDSLGKSVMTFRPAKDYQSVVISLPDIKTGETYSLYTGGSIDETADDGYFAQGEYENGSQTAAITILQTVTIVNEADMTTIPAE